jgi:hypothetical protein
MVQARGRLDIMLHSTVLWRLVDELGGFATCRLVPSGSGFEFHLTVGDESYHERFDRTADVLVRAAEVEQMMLQQGWREVLPVETHLSDAEPRGTFDLHSIDRRRAARVFPGPIPVIIDGNGEGTLVNVSETGALVQVSGEAPQDGDVKLALFWNDATLRLSGRVIRCSTAEGIDADASPCYDVAIGFREVPEDAAMTLATIVRDEQ